MRLLNTKTLTLRFFPGKEKPPYAILSHTWGDDELLFQDISGGLTWAFEELLQDQQKEGLAKVLNSCRLAKANGCDWIWIDTCCIDKSSSAELSEAINSMFRWYAESAICYAYLSDFVHGTDFQGSRWWSRGWTLQELIAPRNVEFFDGSWGFIGNRNQLAERIAEISGVDESILRQGHHRRCGYVRHVRLPHVFEIIGKKVSASGDGLHQRASLMDGEKAPVLQEERLPTLEERLMGCDCQDSFTPIPPLSIQLARVSLSTRMSWASKRRTTREEDISYCLLGLFNVNMPLIYGEGGKAFSRLLEEIIKSSNDQSILAWQGSHTYSSSPPSSPDYYPLRSIYSTMQWTTWEHKAKTDMLVTPSGLQVNTLVCSDFIYSKEITEQFTEQNWFREYLGVPECLGVLDCTVGSDLRARPAMSLRRIQNHEDVYSQRVEYDFTYMVKMQSEEQRLGKTAVVFKLYRNGNIQNTDSQVNLETAKMREITIRNFFKSSQAFGRDMSDILGTRVTIDNTHDYSVAHCVPDIRPDPTAGSSIAIPRTIQDEDCMLFLESSSGPPFAVSWTPGTHSKSSWANCTVHDIDKIKEVVQKEGTKMSSDGEYWEAAKDMTQMNFFKFLYALLKLDKVEKEAPKDTVTRDGFKITAELAVDRFLSQRIAELRISIVKSS